MLGGKNKEGCKTRQATRTTCLRIQRLKEQVKRIAVLNKKVSNFENEAKKKPKTVPVDKVCVETQTTLACEFCTYPCKDLIDLGEHQYQCHGPEEENQPESIICYICGWKLDSKGDLMNHRKEKHLHRVICQYYVKGVFEFEPEVCWYRHESPSSQTITEF